MSNKPEDLILINEEGLRLDGRRKGEIRPMKIEVGVLSRADGSCYLEWGRNKILAGVYGPREAHPRRMQKADSAVIRYKYNMAAFSVEDRARPGPNRRSTEISKVSREAFEPVIMAELYPKAAIDIFVEVLQADAGTRTAAINAASVALADAGIPMRGLVSSCAFGKVEGQIVLDLDRDEDNYGEADFPVALSQDGEITLAQMDGHLTLEEIKEGLALVKVGCKQILQIQREALQKKFGPVEEESKDKAPEKENAREPVESVGALEEFKAEAEVFKAFSEEVEAEAEKVEAEEVEAEKAEAEAEEVEAEAEEVEAEAEEVEAEAEKVEAKEAEAEEVEAEEVEAEEAEAEEVEAEEAEAEEAEAEEVEAEEAEAEEAEAEEAEAEEAEEAEEAKAEEAEMEAEFEAEIEAEIKAEEAEEVEAEEAEFEAENPWELTDKLPEEETEIASEAEEEPKVGAEAEEKGPWKVVKDPGNSGSGDEENE